MGFTQYHDNAYIVLEESRAHSACGGRGHFGGTLCW